MGTSRNVLGRALPGALFVSLVFIALPAWLTAARFGVPAGVNPPAGYFVLTGPDIRQLSDNLSWGDTRHTADFFIEVTGTTLGVFLYDAGLVSPTAGNLDLFFNGDIGTATYVLTDPLGAEIARVSYGSDTEGPGGTNLALATLYDGAAQPGLYRLSVTMDNTATTDEDINAFGVSVPGYDFYSYSFTGGETRLAGGTIREPLAVFPLVLRSTPAIFNSEPITGFDVISYDLDAASSSPPPSLRIITPSTRYADLDVSRDSEMFTTNLRGVDVGPLDGTDYGLWEVRAWDIGLVAEGANDLNIFTLQLCDYAAGVVPTEFPIDGQDPRGAYRIYYERDNGSRPQKEGLIHQATVVGGQRPPKVAFSSDVRVTLTIANPTLYELTDIDVTTRMARDPQFSDPQIFLVSSGLAATANGRDIQVTGRVAAGKTGTLVYDTTFQPTAAGTYYITGDGTDLQGGSLPTDGTYTTPFVQPPATERLGPIHMLRIAADDLHCSISAVIQGDVDICPGQATTLSASSSIVSDCPGGPEVRWLENGLEIFPFPAPFDITVSPGASALYAAELRCAGLQTCTGRAEAQVAVLPAIAAEAGPDATICSEGTALIGGTPAGSGGTGALGYAWAPAAGLSDPASPNPTFTPPSGNATFVLTLTVTDQAGCAATDSVSVRVLPAVYADAGPDVVACQGTGERLGGSPSSSGGTGFLICSWTPAQDLNNLFSCNPICTPSTPASPLSYRLTVTDQQGCLARDDVVVSVVADIPPQTVGNTLTAVRAADDVSLAWTTNASAAYNVRRHTDRTFPRASSQLLSARTTGDFTVMGGVSASPDLAFFRVFAAGCGGTEE